MAPANYASHKLLSDDFDGNYERTPRRQWYTVVICKHQKWERKKPWEYMKICWWGKDVFRLVGQGGGVQTVNNPHTAASRPTTKDFLCLSNPCPFSKKGSQKHQRKWTVCEIEIYLIWQWGNNNHLSPTTHRLALIPPTITPNGPVDKHLYLNNTVF